MVISVLSVSARTVLGGLHQGASSLGGLAQVARNLTDAVDGILLPHRFLICDRDSKCSDQFRRIVKDAGITMTLTTLLRV